jgi:hypothetical protein
MATSFKKDPDATIDYTVDWEDWLAPIEDTIDTVEWIPDASLTVESQSNTATAATAFVSGGVVDEAPILTCRITTAGGRIDDRSITLKIVER